MSPYQLEEIYKLETKSRQEFEDKNIEGFIKTLENDKRYLVRAFEKEIDRLKRGAIYFIGMACWSQEAVPQLPFPLSSILGVLKRIVTTSTRHSLLSEVLCATRSIIQRKELFLEWDIILEIVGAFAAHDDLLAEKKKYD